MDRFVNYIGLPSTSKVQRANLVVHWNIFHNLCALRPIHSIGTSPLCLSGWAASPRGKRTTRRVEIHMVAKIMPVEWYGHYKTVTSSWAHVGFRVREIIPKKNSHSKNTAALDLSSHLRHPLGDIKFILLHSYTYPLLSNIPSPKIHEFGQMCTSGESGLSKMGNLKVGNPSNN